MNHHHLPITAALLLFTPWGLAQQPLCSVLSQQQIAEVSAAAAGKLFSEQPATLGPAQMPKLPATLRVEQCASAMRASGAISLRLGLLTADRNMTPADWKKTEDALGADDKAGPAPARQTVGAASCWKHSWPSDKKGATRLHEASCSSTKGAKQLTLTFEHEDPAQLPALSSVAQLLLKAQAKL